MKERARESLGQMMIFELTDMLKEKITEINERVLNQLDEIEEKQQIKNQNKEVLRTDATKLSYTPVNPETFAIWCEQYKEKIRLEKEQTRTVLDDKPTGKQLFLMNRAAFDDIVLDATADADVEENGNADAAQNN